LLSLHLSSSIDEHVPSKIEFYQPDTSPVDEAPKKISWNPTTTGLMFDDLHYCYLPKDIWEFKVGRHNVVQSFLKNRVLEPKGLKASSLTSIIEPNWIYEGDFLKIIADVSAVLEAKKLVLPLLKSLVKDKST
jgi:hypothetical protein